MPETTSSPEKTPLIRYELDDRLVILARTLHAHGAKGEARLRDKIADQRYPGDSCLGQALYRHRSVFQSAADTPVWRHLELSYFHEMVPADVIEDLVTRKNRSDTDLLRAEILLTTPSSFVLPADWNGTEDRPELQASFEYIDVHANHLNEYREVMRHYCGPAATRLVQSKKVGTFRAMETAAVLYQDPAFDIAWNQIHLCEVNPDGFNGFGQAFADALRDEPPDGPDIADVFADLDRIRTVSRWTFNNPVIEADAALGLRHSSN